MKQEKYRQKRILQKIDKEKNTCSIKTSKNVEMKYTERAMDRLKIQAGLELPPPFYKLCIIMWREYIITISII